MFKYFFYIINLICLTIASSNIETIIYKNIDIDNNFIYNNLEKTKLIYHNSNIDINFYIKNIYSIQLNFTNLDQIIENFNQKNYTDLTLLFLNIFDDYSTNKGISYLNSLCSKYSIIVINYYNIKDNLIPYVISHELAHSYGAIHDDSNKNIMNSVIYADYKYYFNKETKNTLNLNKKCLIDIPKEYLYKTSNIINNTNYIKYNYLTFFSILILFLNI